jgi:hypothetical protein
MSSIIFLHLYLSIYLSIYLSFSLSLSLTLSLFLSLPLSPSLSLSLSDHEPASIHPLLFPLRQLAMRRLPSAFPRKPRAVGRECARRAGLGDARVASRAAAEFLLEFAVQKGPSHPASDPNLWHQSQHHIRSDPNPDINRIIRPC